MTQTSVVMIRIGHCVTDCMTCDCGGVDHVCEKRCSPADCSIHCQSIAEDDFEVRQPEMAIASALHQQTQQLIRHLCLVEPALSVEQPSHLQQPDLHSAPEAALRCLSVPQRMVLPWATPKLCSVLAVDSVCALGGMAVADSAAACFLPVAE